MSETDSKPLLSEYADDPDMAELIELFVGELPERVALLTDALAQGDMDLLAGAAHQIKGAGGGYGFPALTEAGRHLETAARESRDDLETVKARVEDLIDICNRAALA